MYWDDQPAAAACRWTTASQGRSPHTFTDAKLLIERCAELDAKKLRCVKAAQQVSKLQGVVSSAWLGQACRHEHKSPAGMLAWFEQGSPDIS